MTSTSPCSASFFDGWYSGTRRVGAHVGNQNQSVQPIRHISSTGPRGEGWCLLIRTKASIMFWLIQSINPSAVNSGSTCTTLAEPKCGQLRVNLHDPR
jgi:hypothetical protein